MDKVKFKENWILILGNIIAIEFVFIFGKVSNIAWLNYCDDLYDIFEKLKYATFAVAIALGVVIIVKNFKSLKGFLRILVMIIVIAANASMVYVMLGHNGTEVEGLVNIIQVSTEEVESYFSVKNDNSVVKVKCHETVADNLVVDENVLYEMSYRYIENEDKKEGILGYIDICNPVDNR